MFWGWSFGSALVFGLSLSCASTVVLLKALGDRGLLDSVNGKIAVGWLWSKILVMVLVGVITCNSRFTGWQAISTCADQSIWITLGITLLKVTGFIAFMLIIGKRLVPMIMQFVARLGSRELFTLTVVAAAVSIAYGSYAIFGVSMALGLSLQEWWLKSLILAIVPKKKRSLYVKFFDFIFRFCWHAI
jgi:CPA2 family monovalent cation:H+ antiporter-2